MGSEADDALMSRVSVNIEVLAENFSALTERLQRLTIALTEIRDIARVSEGVEFYAMLAQKALDGEDAPS
jgi:hypothetical protein